jgi:hypothetical protein
MSNVLCLDLGTKMGWAMDINLKESSAGAPFSGTVDFSPGRFEGGGMRYLRFRNWLGGMKKVAEGIDTIYFEEVRNHTGVDASHAYGGFLAHLTAWCEDQIIPYSGVPVTTIKKHATGKGNANKQAMIQAMEKKGFKPQNDNEADALALLLWARETNK